MKKKETKHRKLNRIITAFLMVWLILLVTIVNVLRIKFNYPSILLYACMIPVYIVGIRLFQKFLEHSRWSRDFEELNALCEEEEAKEQVQSKRPDIHSLVIIAFMGFLYAIYQTTGIVEEILAHHSSGLSFQSVLPQCVGVLTLLLCCSFIAAILYHVIKGKVFTSSNVRLIYAVGATIVFSTVLQMQCWDATPMVPNSDVQICYCLLGIFIVFFGRLFDIAVELKKEQDLTI